MFCRMTSPTRLSYEESCRLLQSLGYLYGGTIPPLPARMPYADDENPGVSFYKTRVTGEGLENLTIPRTYFGRSQVGPISFRNTDLSESVLCWNDFEGVDFGACDLSRSDLRASNFERVRFVAADLRGGDLRRSSFVACDFTD